MMIEITVIVKDGEGNTIPSKVELVVVKKLVIDGVEYPGTIIAQSEKK